VIRTASLLQVDHSKIRQPACGTQMFSRHTQTTRQCASRRIIARASHANRQEINGLPDGGDRLDGVIIMMPSRCRHRQCVKFLRGRRQFPSGQRQRHVEHRHLPALAHHQQRKTRGLGEDLLQPGQKRLAADDIVQRRIASAPISWQITIHLPKHAHPEAVCPAGRFSLLYGI
jgi:hypothetical protein